MTLFGELPLRTERSDDPSQGYSGTVDYFLGYQAADGTPEGITVVLEAKRELGTDSAIPQLVVYMRKFDENNLWRMEAKFCRWSTSNAGGSREDCKGCFRDCVGRDQLSIPEAGWREAAHVSILLYYLQERSEEYVCDVQAP